MKYKVGDKVNIVPLQIEIKYFDKDITKLSKIAKGDWIDLYSAEDVKLKKGQYYLLRLGIGMRLPKGHEAHVAPRSSTNKNFGVICANSFGIIDNSYCGDTDEWRFPIIATRDTEIHKNDKICQFRIVENQPQFEFVEVEHLDEVNRGGLGSTGLR